MKAIFFGASLVLVSALVSLSAKAEDCSQVDLNGKFKASNGHRYAVSQQNCQVIVVENGSKKITWSFDLTGASPSLPPQEVVAAQAGGGDLGIRSVGSLRIKTKLVESGSDSEFQQTVFVATTMNIPKTEKNKFDVDMQVNGVIQLRSPKRTAKTLRVDSINLEKVKVHLVSVNDSVISGPLADGFLIGANYILDFADVTALVSQLINLERIN